MPNDWATAFNVDKFEAFVIVESIKGNNINITQTSTGNSTTSIIEPTTSPSS